MISEIIKTKNAKTLVYYDTPYTKVTENGFVFNIIEWRDKSTNNEVYEVRLGYLGDEEITPVITLYKANKYSAAIDYLKAIENNASDIYIFENQN